MGFACNNASEASNVGVCQISPADLRVHAPDDSVVRNIANGTLFDSKFFGNPQGAKSKPQQSTLAFNPAQLSKAEKSKDPKVNSTNGSVTENGTEDSKNREDDGDVEIGGNSGTLKTISKGSALKVEKSKRSRDKTLYSIESTVADENIKDGKVV